MEMQKTACVIYVASTKTELAPVKEKLEGEGYKVTSLLVSTDIAQYIKENNGQVPLEVRKLIEQTDLCIFLLPEESAEDSGMQGAAGLAVQMGKRVVGLVAGSRTIYPTEFDLAGSMIRISSSRLKSVIQGENIWEEADKSPAKYREIYHQRCQ